MTQKKKRPSEIVWRYPQSMPMELLPKSDGQWGSFCSEGWSASVLNLKELFLALSALLHSYSQPNHTTEAVLCNKHCVELPWYTKIQIKFSLLALRRAMISKHHLSNVQLNWHCDGKSSMGCCGTSTILSDHRLYHSSAVLKQQQNYQMHQRHAPHW